ncbi:hypothetical protein A9Q84_11225 [Halobacteriovorax marinus]|uniref:Lipoprotein n=1 Tax=Halobacteriovorax marinus TaxID=97084 RepID=A0A1Y5FDF4_9BACT|nr:hypothetical protein A9Q84_11225 [Halobacteriovorax marinus]
MEKFLKMSLYPFLFITLISNTSAVSCPDLSGDYQVESIAKNCKIKKNSFENFFYLNEIPLPLSLNNKQRLGENSRFSIVQKGCNFLTVSKKYDATEIKEMNLPLDKFTPLWDVNVVDLFKEKQVKSQNKEMYVWDENKIYYTSTSKKFSMGHPFGLPRRIKKTIKFSYEIKIDDSQRKTLILRNRYKFRGDKVEYVCVFPEVE